MNAIEANESLLTRLERLNNEIADLKAWVGANLELLEQGRKTAECIERQATGNVFPKGRWT